MARATTTDLLMWVGVQHYPTVTSFVREAVQVGVSKRVARVPIGVKLGHSLLFFAHDEAVRVTCASCKGRGVKKGKLEIELVKKVGRSWEPVLRPSKKGAVEIRNEVDTVKMFKQVRKEAYRTSGRKHKWRPVPGQKMCSDCRGHGERPDGRIFGFCVVERLELLFDCASAAKEYKERRETLRKQDRIPITHIPGIEKEPKRRCGYRQVGGYYLMAFGENAAKGAETLSEGLGAGFKVHGPLVVFPVPVAYPEGRFRAAKVVDKHEIIQAAVASAKRLNRARKRWRTKRRGK